MGNILNAGLVVAVLVLILRLAVRGRLSSFNPSRAAMRVESLHGNNATLMLSAVALASLAVSIASNAERWHAASGRVAPLLVGGLVIALVSLVAFRSADTILGIVGFGAELAAAGLEHGEAGVLSVLVLAMLLLIVLGFVRGFVRP